MARLGRAQPFPPLIRKFVFEDAAPAPARRIFIMHYDIPEEYFPHKWRGH